MELIIAFTVPLLTILTVGAASFLIARRYGTWPVVPVIGLLLFMSWQLRPRGPVLEAGMPIVPDEPQVLFWLVILPALVAFMIGAGAGLRRPTTKAEIILANLEVREK